MRSYPSRHRPSRGTGLPLAWQPRLGDGPAKETLGKGADRATDAPESPGDRYDAEHQPRARGERHWVTPTTLVPSAERAPEARIGIDVGGTFTDVACIVNDRITHVFKVPSTRDDPSRAVLDAIHEITAVRGIDPGSVRTLAHGTTVATNAVLERKGARVGLLGTEGFRDVLEIGRQLRQELYSVRTRSANAGVPGAPAATPRDRRARRAPRGGPDPARRGERRAGNRRLARRGRGILRGRPAVLVSQSRARAPGCASSS